MQFYPFTISKTKQSNIVIEWTLETASWTDSINKHDNQLKYWVVPFTIPKTKTLQKLISGQRNKADKIW